jgi:hypothetical protein
MDMEAEAAALEARSGCAGAVALIDPARTKCSSQRAGRPFYGTIVISRL